MIRINLANSLINKSDVSSSSAGSSMSGPREIATKVLLVLAPLIGIYAYEKHDLQQKQEQVATMTQQHSALTEELAKVGSVDDVVRVVNEQKKDLDDRFAVMSQIFGRRSQKLAVLVALQNQIPSSCWLTKIDFEDTVVSIAGYATASADAQSFASSLVQDRVLFESVQAEGITAEKVNSLDLFKFEIKAKLKE